MALSAKRINRYIKPLLFILMATPAAWLGWQLYLALLLPNDLTANPIEFSNRFLGDWALRYLFLSLAITPLVDWTGLRALMALRRMIGLYAFFMVVLHVSSYVALDHFFNWAEIWGDILKRNFITLGFISLLGLVPLAVTSNKAMIKRLGGKRWQGLHRLIYPISVLALVHYVMMVRGNQLEPKVYIAMLTILLGWRVWKWVKHRVLVRP